MKNNLLKQVAFFIGATTILGGCAKSEIEPDMPDASNGITITAMATTLTEPETRLGYTEGTSSMSFTWEKQGDTEESFSVFAKEAGEAGAPVTFSQTSGQGENNGTFTGTFSTEPGSGEELYAIYPKLETNPTDRRDIELDLSNQTLATTPADLKHNKSHYMWAKSTYAGNNTVDFSFKHLVAILKVEMTLPNDAGAVKAVRLSGLNTKSSFDVVGGELYRGEVGEVVMTNADGITLADHKLTAYIFLFPQDLSGKNLQLTVTDDAGKAYGVDFEGRSIVSGKVYKLVKDLERVYRPGSFYQKDGTILSRDTQLSDEQKGNCLGIVFMVNADGSHGKIVSLNENGEATWGAYGAETSATDALNGLKNMAAVKTYNNDFSQFPHFLWAHNLNTSGPDYSTATTGVWYLPTSKELHQLFAAMNGLKWVSSGADSAKGEIDDWEVESAMPDCDDYETVRVNFNESFTAVNGTAIGLTDYYWSSEEINGNEAYSVFFYDGTSCAEYKIGTSNYKARAIYAF